MLRDEFQRQRLGRRPGQGRPVDASRPGLEIGEIGGERPKAVLAHAFLGEMLEILDVVIGENLGERSRRSIGRMAASARARARGEFPGQDGGQGRFLSL